jgi:lipoprotein-releasing system permease protein
MKSLNLSIAKSLLLARWRQTLVAAIGVTFSITMFIALLSFMTGLNDLLDSLIVNRTPHIRLYNEIKATEEQPVELVAPYSKTYNFIHSVKAATRRQELYNSGAVIRAVAADPRVLGTAPRVSAQVFFNEGSTDLTGLINGVDVEAENKLFHFSDYVVGGNYMDLKNVTNSIILGKALADIILANAGDVVQVTTSRGEILPLKVVGFFQSGIQDYDKVQCYASINTTQKMLGVPNNYITDVQVKLNDISLAPAVAKEYSERFNADAMDIQTANAQFETGNSIRTLISYSVGIVLLIVAGFGIYNILNMMIYEKMDSIAILKATGFSGRDVKRIFILVALSIGVFGGITGIFFGYVLSAIIDQVPFITAALPTVKTYPINYNPAFYLIASVFSLLTTYFAGWFPARKASKVDPVVIIRGK